MTIKLKAPRAYYYDADNECHMAIKGGTHRVVSEADWRKLMKLVRLLDARSTSLFADEQSALDALKGAK